MYLTILSWLILLGTINTIFSKFNKKKQKSVDLALKTADDKVVSALLGSLYLVGMLKLLFIIPFWIGSAAAMPNIQIVAVTGLYASFTIVYSVRKIFRDAYQIKNRSAKFYHFDKVVSILNLCYIVVFLLFFR